MVERDVTVLVLLIDQHRMTLREGAALGVLAGEPHRMTLQQQRAKCERLGRRPVDAFAALDRLAASFQEPLDGPMYVEALGYRRDLPADLFERGERRAGMAATRLLGIACCLDIGPAAVEPISAVGLVALARLQLGVKLSAPINPYLLDFDFGDDIFTDKLLTVDLAGGRVLADRLVHQRLGERRLVALVVPKTPVAKHIDDDRTLEFLTKLGGDFGRKYHRLRIVAVHVEDRRLNHLGNVG